MNTVSVIIPTYKNRGGLQRSVESALKQDYAGLIEVIVVDDNNPESGFRKSTEELMRAFADNPKVKYLKHEVNKNGAAARNTGIKAATGDLIAFLDDDDIFLDGKLTKQINYLAAHPEFDAVYCLARKEKYGAPQMVIEGDGTRKILLLESNFYTPSLLFKKKALEAINGFDETFKRHQDYELLLRYFKAGFKIGCVPEILIEIGCNRGENTPSGDKLEELKKHFFAKFDTFIENEDNKTPGFASKVYAKHYAGVFLSHIKNHHWCMALRTLVKYFPKSPQTFYRVLSSSVKAHLQ